MPRYCPDCNVVLTSTEYAEGRCGDCGATFGSDLESVSGERPEPAAPRPLNTGPGPISTVPRQSLAAKPLATLLFLATLGSFFLPWGMFVSIRQGFDKGTGLCACAGCLEKPTEFVEYGNGFVVEEKLGYCQAHADTAPKDFTITQGKSFSVLLAVVMVIGPGLYLLWFLVALLGVYREEHNAMAAFLLFVAAGLILLNALSYGYWHYCHFAFRHSGW